VKQIVLYLFLFDLTCFKKGPIVGQTLPSATTTQSTASVTRTTVASLPTTTRTAITTTVPSRTTTAPLRTTAKSTSGNGGQFLDATTVSVATTGPVVASSSLGWIAGAVIGGLQENRSVVC
jgi:hypothetical protein